MTTQTMQETEMLQYIPTAGTHIGRACRDAVQMAVAHAATVGFTFNDIEMEATPESHPEKLEKKWQEKMEARTKAYRESPEGIAAANKRKAKVEELRKSAERLMEALPDVLAENRMESVIGWFKEYLPVADDVGVDAPGALIADKLQEAGYKMGEYVGKHPNFFDTKEKMGRYIIGQVIEGFKNYGFVAQVASLFIERWEQLES